MSTRFVGLSTRMFSAVVVLALLLLPGLPQASGAPPAPAAGVVGDLPLTPPGEVDLRAAVVDPAAGFAYFATSTTPGAIVKLRLSDFTRVGVLVLQSDERRVKCAAIDTAGGYAYLGVGEWSDGRVVRVRLSDFTRAGSLDLSTGGEPGSAAIDPVGGYLYVGGSDNLVEKVRLSDFSSMGTLALASSEEDLRSAVVDSAAGYAYFASLDAEAVVKIRLSDFTRVGVLALGLAPVSALIDPAGGYAYFGAGYPQYNRIARVRLSDFSLVDTLTLNADERDLQAAAIDPAGGYAYFGTYTVPGRVVRVRLSDFTRVNALTLNTGEDNLRSAVVDPAGGYAYFGTGYYLSTRTYQGAYPGKVVRVRLSDLTHAGTLTLQQGEDRLNAAALDRAAGYAYFATDTAPGRVVKVRLQDFTRVAARSMAGAEDYPSSAVIDPGRGYAYFGLNTSPGKIVRLRLADFTFDSTLTLAAGEDGLTAAVIDPTGGYAYFGTNTSPGKVVKVNLSSFTATGTLTLDAGENRLGSAVIYPAGGYAYFGTRTGPGKVVRVQLSDFTHAGTVALPNPGVGDFGAAVIDPAGGYAYFALADDDMETMATGGIARVNLGTFTLDGTLFTTGNECCFRSAVIDPVGGKAYFGGRRCYYSGGSYCNPYGYVLRLRLSDFALETAQSLRYGNEDPRSAVIDAGTGHAYFGTYTMAGVVVKVQLDRPEMLNKLYLPAAAYNSGQR